MARIKVGELYVPIVADSSGFVNGLNQSTSAARGFSKSIDRIFGYKLFKDAVRGAISLGKAAKKAGGYVVGLAMDAAPLEGIGQAFQSMASTYDVSLKDMQAATAGTVSDFELMRQANIALTGASEELGMAMGERLPDLLIGARAAARSTGRDVEYLFDSLVNGVKRSSPRLIDNTGIVIELGEANKQLADDLGITVEELTNEQKTLATLNATADAGLGLAEQVGLQHLTAAERVQQTTTAFKNATDQIGLAFNPVVKTATMGLTELINNALGPVAEVMARTVAPAADIVIGKFFDMANAAVTGGNQTYSALARTLGSAASSAAEWGFNIIAQLAIGIMQGIATALTKAMNALSAALSFFMAPHSPPRVAPDLPEWGKGAMEEYLKGFTNASFDILDGVQRPLERALQSLEDAGAIGEGAADSIFQGVSRALIQAIDLFNKTGEVSEGIFERLRDVGGKYGDQLAQLAQRQFELARATDEVREAEAALRKARAQSEKSQNKLTDEIEKYNEMLRAGAGSGALEAQRDRVMAARDEMEQAEDQLDQAEKRKEAAEDTIDPLEEQVRVQERLLEQMLELTKLQDDVNQGASAGAGGGGIGGGAGLGGGGGLEIPELDTGGFMPDPDDYDLGGLQDIFDDAKDKLEKKLADIFDPLVEQWNKNVAPKLKEMRKAWDNLMENLKKAWDKWGKPIADYLSDLIPPELLESIGVIIGKFAGWAIVAAVVVGALGLVAVTLGLLLNPILAIIVLVGELHKRWNEKFGDMNGKPFTLLNVLRYIKEWWVARFESVLSRGIEKINRKWDELKEKMNRVKEFIVTDFGGAIKKFNTWVGQNFSGTLEVLGLLVQGDVQGAFEAWKELISTQVQPVLDLLDKFINENLKPSFTALKEVVGDNVNAVLSDMYALFNDDILPAMKDIWKFIEDKLIGKFEDLEDTVSGGVSDALSNFTDNVLGPLKSALEGVGNFIDNVIGKLDKLNKKSSKVKAPSPYEKHSPSPFEQALMGVNAYMNRLSTQEIPRLRREMKKMDDSSLVDRASFGAMGRVGAVTAGGVQNNYFNMEVRTNAASPTVQRDFELMRQRVPAAT